MITYPIIQKSQLEGAHRLDAEYYQPEYLELESFLHKLKTDSILDLTKFVKKGVFDLSPENYLPEGIPFVRVQNIKNGFLDDQNLVFISQDVHKKEHKTELNSFDIVFSKIGTVGEVSFIPNRFPVANFSQNVIGIKIDGRTIPKGFLLFFLLSKFGQLQIARANMLQVQAKLELKDIRNLKVIRLGDEEDCFHQELLKIESLFENSKSLYSQAENLLLEELGLQNVKEKEGLWSIINFSDIKTAGRMDAEYFDPKYSRLQEILKGAKRLSDIAERRTKGTDVNLKNEYNYIEISDVNAGDGEISSNKILGQDLPANAKLKVDGGELIVSKVRPTRGAIAIIPEDWKKDYVASGAFSVFKIESPTREYLQVLLRSAIGKLQLEKPTTGTSYPTVTDQDVENILIPILSKSTQQKIADLVRKSHEARKKAKELLEEAKRKVEKLIEQ